MHYPVMKAELVKSLDIHEDGIYIDCTGGGGGHAAEVVSQLTTGKLIILDRDPEAVNRLKEKFEKNSCVHVVHANYKELPMVLNDLGIDAVDGLFADFGISSWQLNAEERGFSFRKDGELDMRMDPTEGESAKDVVNKYSQELLEEIIYRYGEERFFRRVAKAIVTRRAVKPFSNTIDFANVVKAAIPAKFHKYGYHPATQTFQALRIHVNQELVAIESLMRLIPDVTKVGARVVFITFHSLEDRLVKEYLVRYEKECICPPDFPMCACDKRQEFKLITRKPMIPTEGEVKENALSRSAKMRVAERV